MTLRPLAAADDVDDAGLHLVGVQPQRVEDEHRHALKALDVRLLQRRGKLHRLGLKLRNRHARAHALQRLIDSKRLRVSRDPRLVLKDKE